MPDVTDLQAYKNSKMEPDPEFVKTDEFGRKLYTFSYEFDHSDGKRYGFEIWAYDFEDAEAKMTSIRESGRIIGMLHGTVPA
jgi:hypothetical protein